MKNFKYISSIWFIVIITLINGCAPPPSYYHKKKIKKAKMRKLKIGITKTFKLNSLTITPTGNYNILVSKRRKGTLYSKHTYKVGIYKGYKVVIAKQKVYDQIIYLEGQTGKEMLKINGTTYRGNFFIEVNRNRFKVINHIDLEDYLYGVVGKEIYHSWSYDAIRAQAVVARTYTLQNLGKYKKEGFDLTDTPTSQVYGGVNAESDKIRKAVDKTEGEVIIYKNKMASVYFHSCCGGFTENIKNAWNTQKPPIYLVKKRCPHCKSAPIFKWETELKFSEIKKVLEKNGYKTGNITKIKIRSYEKSGRVRELSIHSRNSAFTIKATDFRNLFIKKIKSTMFKINNKKDSVYFKGKGNGHGVGMCQYGSKKMAEKNYSYKSIIKYYFPKTGIQKWQKL